MTDSLKKITFIVILPTVFGCGSIPPDQYFCIHLDTASLQERSNPTTYPFTLAVQSVKGSSSYKQESVMYRQSPYKIGFYPYHKWEAPPVRMVSEELFEAFLESGLFRRVLKTGVGHDVDYLLRGRIKSFEEVDIGDKWFAHVELYMEFVDKREGQVLWRDIVERRTEAEKRNLEAIAKAMSISLGDCINEIMDKVNVSLIKSQKK